MEKQRLGAASSESKQSTAISNYEVVKVPGDGHCLYSAVGLYVGKDQKQLPEQVAKELESKLNDYKNYIELKFLQTPKEYIEGVQRGSEWAGYAEIIALTRILQRPIIVVRPNEIPQLRIKNTKPEEKEYYGRGVPILVSYNDRNHYDALILVAQDSPLPLSQKSNTNHTLFQSPSLLTYATGVKSIQDKLILACRNGDEKAVKTLLEQGAKSNLPNGTGEQPLGAAVWSMCPAIVTALLEQSGASMTWEKCEEHNLLYYHEVFIIEKFSVSTYSEWYQFLKK